MSGVEQLVLSIILEFSLTPSQKVIGHMQLVNCS